VMTFSRASLFLAFRYLRPKRSFVSVITAISILGVLLGVGVLVVVMAVFQGWQVEFRKLLLGFEPHILMVQDAPPALPPGFEADPANDAPQQSNWRDVLPVAKAQPGVLSAVPIAVGVLVVEAPTEMQGVEVFGLKSGVADPLVDRLKKHLIAGEFQLDEDSIVITNKFADKIGAKLGDTVVVHGLDNIRRMVRGIQQADQETDPTKRDEVYDDVYAFPMELKVTGLLREDTAGMRGYVPLTVAQDLFNLEDGISGIEVELADPEAAPTIAGQIFESGKLPYDWTLRTWQDGQGSMLASVENQQSLLYFLLLIIVLVAAICVMNTTITVTVQKRREIGILTALGTRRNQVIAIFVAQAFVVASIGIVLGIISGAVFLAFRNEFRALLAQWTGRDFFPQDIYFLSSIPAKIVPIDLAAVCGMAMLLCLLAALIPAWFAARVDPAVALRD